MKELLLQMIFFLFVLNNKFLLLSVSTCRYVAYRQYTFWTTTSEIVIAIRVLNMPTEDWQLMSLGGSYATLLNLDLCSVTTASFSCMRCDREGFRGGLQHWLEVPFFSMVRWELSS